MLDLLFGQDWCEVFHLKDLADFDFVVAGAAVGATLDPLDSLVERLDLQDREPGDELQIRSRKPVELVDSSGRVYFFKAELFVDFFIRLAIDLDIRVDEVI